MPLSWGEVDASLDPKRYTIRNAVERMESMGADPMLPALEQKPDLAAALQRLATVLSG
jgi:DNA primase